MAWSIGTQFTNRENIGIIIVIQNHSRFEHELASACNVENVGNGPGDRANGAIYSTLCKAFTHVCNGYYC